MQPDIVATEVIRSGLLAAAEEASLVVVKASHSTFVQEGADACAALLDLTGRLVAQSTATSLLHSASLRCAVPHLLERFPIETLREGDVLASNDTYGGGIHANDIIIVEPVFADGRPVFLAGTVIHVADVGGAAAGGLASVATDIFQEGLQLPPVKLHDAGEPVAAIWEILAANSRVPGKVLGDVRALIAGTSTLRRRVEELCDRWTAPTVETVVEQWFDYAERWVRQELAALPDGRWTGSYTIDTDGVTEDRSYTVSVTATIEGDRCTLDLTGSSTQAVGAINSSFSQSSSGAIFAFRCFIDPTIPMNEGSLRPLTVELPTGSIVNPRRPAACGGRVVTVAAIVEAAIEALAGARPELQVAASGLVHVFTLAGASGGTPWLALLYEFGGLGARSDGDGPDATGAYFFGGRSVVPQIEPIEASLPVRYERISSVRGSGGQGRHRGGDGAEHAIELLEPSVASVRGDRVDVPPPGRSGGEPGTAGSFTVRRVDGRLEQLRSKQSGIALDAGDVLIVRTSGGGGLGVPEPTGHGHDGTTER